MVPLVSMVSMVAVDLYAGIIYHNHHATRSCLCVMQPCHVTISCDHVIMSCMRTSAAVRTHIDPLGGGGWRKGGSTLVTLCHMVEVRTTTPAAHMFTSPW